MTEPTKPVNLDELERLKQEMYNADSGFAGKRDDYLYALDLAAPTIIAELRKLRALRDEVEPVLRWAGDFCRCKEDDCPCTTIRDILARHYDKKEPTK